MVYEVLPVIKRIESFAGQWVKPAYRKYLLSNLTKLVSADPARSILSKDGNILPEYAEAFARQFLTVFEVKREPEAFVEELKREGVVEAREPREIVPQELYNALVLSEMTAQHKDEKIRMVEGRLKRREALIDAIRALHKLEITEEEWVETLIKCISVLGFSDLRGYAVNLKTGEWLEKFAHGVTTLSRFKDRAGAPEENEEKNFFGRVLQRKISDGMIDGDKKAGLYTLYVNDKWAYLHVPKRADCYFANRERLEADRRMYPGGNVEEITFLSLGSPRGEQVEALQMTNWTEENTTFIKDQREFFDHLQTFAGALAQFKENRILHEEKKTLSNTDPLTQVKNRRYFQEKLLYDLKMAVRLHYPLSLLMVDIDYFKNINDTYGHQFGDKVLCGVVKKIQEQVRDTDTVARYGGEEFIIILPGADGKGGGEGEDACQVAERIRKSVEELVFPFGDEEVKVTISIGVTYAYPEEIRDILDGTAEGKEDLFLPLIEQADRALYAAKRGGRNRILLFAPELPPAK